MVTTEAVRARAPRSGIAADLRAVRIVFHREMIRFSRDGKRASSMLLQAILWLFVMGAGLGSLLPDESGGVDMRTFLFPGVIAMSVILTAMSSAASVVWDREFGFLREMLVAPVSRGAIVIGKVLGGATLATAQGALVLALAGFVGIPYDPLLMLTLLGEMFLAAFAITAFGVMAAARVRSIESFFGVSQMMLMPLMFLSGAFFPIGNLPGWLAALTRVNPVTYAVDPMRQAVFGHLDPPPHIQQLFNPGIEWFGWSVPVFVQLCVVGGAGVIMLAIAIAKFRKTD
jgi:ABC-2 type transport system permease protein